MLSSLLVKNVKITGFAKTQIKSVKTDFTDNEMKIVIDVAIPRLEVTGKYKGESRLTNLNYSPKGTFNNTIGRNRELKSFFGCGFQTPHFQVMSPPL